MSEYQYYEFLAIDRPLSKEQMAELRALSTRATITSTRFQNTYNYGDFRGDPEVLMEKYFDAHLYVANWGTHEFMLRLPERLLGRDTTSLYCSCDTLDVHLTEGFVVLEFRAEDEEGGEWEEGEGWMESLVPVRGELGSGDLRALYLGWLLCAQSGFLDDDQMEPPVPPGLGVLSAPLQALTEFLWIDEDLLAVAAERSAPLRDDDLSNREIEGWVVGLPDSEKDSLLLRLVDGEANLRAELVQRFRQSRAATTETGLREGTRSVAELLAAAEQHATNRKREEERREAEKRARLEQERATARVKYLDSLTGQETELWRQVEVLVERKQAKEYDQATRIVKDLHDLAIRSGQTGEFDMRLDQLRQQYANRPSFIKRLVEAKLKAIA